MKDVERIHARPDSEPRNHAENSTKLLQRKEDPSSSFKSMKLLSGEKKLSIVLRRLLLLPEEDVFADTLTLLRLEFWAGVDFAEGTRCLGMTTSSSSSTPPPTTPRDSPPPPGLPSPTTKDETAVDESPVEMVPIPEEAEFAGDDYPMDMDLVPEEEALPWSPLEPQETLQERVDRYMLEYGVSAEEALYEVLQPPAECYSSDDALAGWSWKMFINEDAIRAKWGLTNVR